MTGWHRSSSPAVLIGLAAAASLPAGPDDWIALAAGAALTGGLLVVLTRRGGRQDP